MTVFRKFEQLAQPIFDAIQSGKVDKIVSVGMANSEAAKYMSQADIDLSNSQYESYFKAFSKFYSYRLLHEQGIKGDFWSRWYLLKFDRQPVVLYLEFYKKDQSWSVQRISLKSDLDIQTEKSGDIVISTQGYNKS
ncbi:MAG: hypothetical protein V7782_06035 [Psychromonas sp.]